MTRASDPVERMPLDLRMRLMSAATRLGCAQDKHGHGSPQATEAEAACASVRAEVRAWREGLPPRGASDGRE